MALSASGREFKPAPPSLLKVAQLNPPASAGSAYSGDRQHAAREREPVGAGLTGTSAI